MAMHAQDPRWPLGLVRDAVSALYDRALSAGPDFSLHDEFAEGLSSMLHQWDAVVGSAELSDPAAHARTWDSARQAACHPFMVKLIDQDPAHEGHEWRALISAPDLQSAWKVAEELARSNNSREVDVVCSRRCWHCLKAAAEWDVRVREAVAAEMSEGTGVAYGTVAPFATLRATPAGGTDGPATGWSYLPVKPVYLDDASTNGHQ